MPFIDTLPGLIAIIAFIVIVQFPVAFLSADIAFHKGYGQGKYFLCGVLFGIFALIHICAIPLKENSHKEQLKSDNLE